MKAQNLESTEIQMTGNPKIMLDSAISLVDSEMVRVNQSIQDYLNSDIALINTLGQYIIKSGGKRLRPLILLLSAKCCGYQGSHHILLATIIEFIHTATLLHDDVVDASATRRGQPTANEVWGNEASVLVGDFLYSRSFEMMVATNRMDVMKILAQTTNAIAEGEVMQLLNAHSPNTSESQYIETIQRKTAKLFESATLLGATISDCDEKIRHAFANYGMYLGTAFQMIDDILDYDAQSEDIGKDIGDDLSEGKSTLPLIYAMEHGNRKQRDVISNAIENGDREKIHEILDIVKSTGAIEYTFKQAQIQSKKAISSLSEVCRNEFRKALIDMAEFSIRRRN